jgi:hypothetical protein
MRENGKRMPVHYGLYVEMLVGLAFVGVIGVSLVGAALLDLRDKLQGR